ncbi:MAG: PhzF family phenazine biosynthesis protein [Acidobacteriota bacterium]
MRLHFYTADVFTETAFGGNQLAVFPQAEGLGGDRMQQIARELNLSETVFVRPPRRAGQHFDLRIFTPRIEVPFAGHPTIGAALVLAAIGAVKLQGDETTVVLGERVGPIEVKIRIVDGQPRDARFTTAMLPEFGPPPPVPEALARMLALEPADLLLETRPPMAVSCGLPFLLIPLRSLAAVSRARLDLGLWQDLLADFWAPHVHLFAHEAELPGCDLHARMFAPAAGVPEDPATGSAAAALAGLLAARSPELDGTLRWVVEQGLEIERPSILEIEADKAGGEIIAVRVGGSAVMMSEGWMEIPDRGAADG